MKITLVDYWAPWCGPCKMVTPLLKEVAREQDVTLLEVNVDEYPTVSVFSIPTVVFEVDGVEVRRIVGARPKRDYVTAIDQIRTP